MYIVLHSRISLFCDSSCAFTRLNPALESARSVVNFATSFRAFFNFCFLLSAFSLSPVTELISTALSPLTTSRHMFNTNNEIIQPNSLHADTVEYTRRYPLGAINSSVYRLNFTNRKLANNMLAVSSREGTTNNNICCRRALLAHSR